jgi:predicted nucleic acid-binding protein
MLVIDTSIWIEWLVAGALSENIAPYLQIREHCIVPTIVQLELSKWLLRERSEQEADTIVAYTQKCSVVPLDTTIALHAAELCKEYKLATADAIIYATALNMKAGLITCDAHFADLPDVTFLSKIATN